jgi:hypothetical protein
MAEAKTKKTEASVEGFINSLPDEQKRKDSFVVSEMMKQATKMDAKMWGSSIVGFGSYHYKYESGREGDICMIGFSPRKSGLVLYLMAGLDPFKEEFKKLGKYKTGKGCLYITKLSDVDTSVLKKMIQKAAKLGAQKK